MLQTAARPARCRSIWHNEIGDEAGGIAEGHEEDRIRDHSIDEDQNTFHCAFPLKAFMGALEAEAAAMNARASAGLDRAFKFRGSIVQYV